MATQAAFLFRSKVTNNSYETNISNNFQTYQIKLNKIIYQLNESNKKFKVTKRLTNDGVIYNYIKISNDDSPTAKELEKRNKTLDISFSKLNKEIIAIYSYVESLGVEIVFKKNMNNIAGLWQPSKKRVILSEDIIRNGTFDFHNILSHEAIHIAQSCNNGFINSPPSRIGLPLKDSYKIKAQLSHPIYSTNTRENKLIEREAYSYAKEKGIALKLLKRFCQTKTY